MGAVALQILMSAFPGAALRWGIWVLQRLGRKAKNLMHLLARPRLSRVNPSYWKVLVHLISPGRLANDFYYSLIPSFLRPAGD